MANQTSSPGADDKLELDDVMLAMDVVDTLRHEKAFVDRHLAQDDRDETLKKRLREIYEGQGLEVTDTILNEGIKALRENRFIYEPPTNRFGVFLAKIWIWRLRVSSAIAAMIVAIGAYIGVGSYQEGAKQRAQEAARIELTETLPNQFEAQLAKARDIVRTNEASSQISAADTSFKKAIARQDLTEARDISNQLQALISNLEKSYRLVVVSRPGERSGVFRVPDGNSSVRNYYLIVERIAADGEVLDATITSEETGKSATVSKYGVRVPRRTYDIVARDKQDDGIIQQPVLGEKLQGYLKPTYKFDVEPGRITEW